MAFSKTLYWLSVLVFIWWDWGKSWKILADETVTLETPHNKGLTWMHYIELVHSQMQLKQLVVRKGLPFLTWVMHYIACHLRCFWMGRRLMEVPLSFLIRHVEQKDITRAIDSQWINTECSNQECQHRLIHSARIS